MEFLYVVWLGLWRDEKNEIRIIGAGNHFHGSVSAQVLREQADAMVYTGLAAAGYQYINTDDGFVNAGRSSDGRLVPGPNFGGNDSSMMELSKYIESKGLKFGVYEAEGLTTCMSRSGSLRYESVDAETFASSWGASYAKIDNCGEVNLNSYGKFSAMRDALNATGVGIVYSSEPHLTVPISWPPFVAHSWRTGGDITPDFSRIMEELALVNGWAYVTGAYAHGDSDILEVGQNGLTISEQRVHFALWSMVKSPLLIGCDLTATSNDSMAILLNRGLIAVNQDDLVEQATLRASFPGTSRLDVTRAIQQRWQHAFQLALHGMRGEQDDSFEGLTECEYRDSPASSAQSWTYSHGTFSSGSSCLTRTTNDSVSIAACTSNNPQQQWIAPNITRTMSQIVSTTNSSNCLGTPDGQSLVLTPCLDEPVQCYTSRCANSVLVNQLWYLSNTTHQLISSFTNTSVPPLHLEAVQAADIASLGAATTVLTQPCNTSNPFQRWNASQNTLRVPNSDLCFNGPSSIAPCSAGNSEQTWTFEGPPSLNLRDGKNQCLDLYNFSGPAVQLFNCKSPDNSTRGSQNEEWVLDENGMVRSQVSQACCGTPSRPIPEPLCLARVPPTPEPLINKPFCVATSPNPSPPPPPPLPPAADPSLPLQVWAGNLTQSRFVVALVNAQDAQQPTNITANFADIGIPADKSFSVTDLYAERNLGTFKDAITLAVPHHDVAALLLTPT